MLIHNNRLFLLLMIVIFSGFNFLNAQENDSLITLEYNTTIESANELFDNKNYDEAIELYKEAQVIKPDEEYPKFKLEDINTILEIRKQIAQPTVQKEKRKPFWKKKKKKDKTVLNTKTVASLKEEPVKVEKKETVHEEKPIEEKKTIARAVMGIEARPIKEKVVESEKMIETLIIEEEPKSEIINKKSQEVTTVEEIEKKPNIKNQTPKPKIKPKQKTKPKVKQKTQEEIYTELKALYTEEMTVEVFETPNKTTTKVVINKGGNIVIFSKVEHSWGGVYYFKEIPGAGEESIVKEYFVRETKYTK